MDEFIKKLKRGTVEIITEAELQEKLKRKKRLNIKFGIDPTSKDLHLGHTVPLRKIRLFQDYGHKIILVIGDFTARIGDPSGRDETRPILTDEEIKENIQTYQEQLFKILSKENIEIVYNSKWLLKLFQVENIWQLNQILQNIFGKYTVAQLLQREEFSKRQQENKPITLLELIYPLFQAYDSLVIDSDVEIGGADQLFNLLIGRQMQKDHGKEPQIAITLPLLLGTDGVKKMSKSYNNYIALNDPPDEMFGKIMSIPDDIMYSYFELLTDYDIEKIKNLHPREAKEILAFEITKTYHGEENAKKSREEFRRIFSEGKPPTELKTFLTDKKNWRLSHLIYSCGLADSRKEAQRLIKQKAVEINGLVIQEDNIIEVREEFILKVGKRKFIKIKPQM